MALLERWAAGCELVVASFFFWKPGSSLQKSLTGLLRSLLHDVLQTCPDLIPDVLPEQWKAMRVTAWGSLADIRFPDKDIRRAFTHLIADPKLYEGRRFCFFIDGLDEYEGTLQEDAKSLVDLLCFWTSAAPGNIKLCVSSREHNVFMNAFPEANRIRLHHLTSSDMIQYVSDKLGHMDNDCEKEKLTESVVDNAHGIFLWVVVVIKRIREQIENGNNVEELLREIDSLPQELDGLFSHILDSLPKSDLKKAYQTFAMLLATEGTIMCISPLAYSFLDEYDKDPEFASRGECGTNSTQLEPNAIRTRSDLASRRLRGCCKGFVEIVTTHRSHPQKLRKIDFTHRSMPEFLSCEARRDHMLHLLHGFNAVDALSQLTLAELSVNAKSVHPVFFSDRVQMLVPLRKKQQLDRPPFQFLEALSKATMRARNFDRPYLAHRFPETHRIYISQLPGHYTHVAHCGDAQPFYSAAANNPQLPIYSAAFHGNLEYVKWTLRQPLGPGVRISLQILLYCLLMSEHGDTAVNSLPELLQTVDFLITQGLTPQLHTDISILSVYAFEERDPSTRRRVNLTVWQHLLLSCYHCTIWQLMDRLPTLGYVLERYLENGADPHFEFYATSPESADREWESDPGNWILKVVAGREKRELLLRFSSRVWRPYTCGASSAVEFLEIFRYHFENWDRILQLVERNTKRLEGTMGIETDEVVLDGKEDAEEEQLRREKGVQKAVTPRKTTNIGSGLSVALLPVGVLAFGTLLAIIAQLLWITA